MELPLKEIAALLDGTIEGNADTVITGVAGIKEAREGDITFLANPKYAKYVESTRASAIVCGPDTASETKTLLKVDNPYLAYAKALRYLNPPPPESGKVDERAFIGKNTRIGARVTVYPFAYIGSGCVIEDGATIHPHCFIGNGVHLGENTLIQPGVTILERCVIGKRVIIQAGTVIGSDGFGYARDGAKYYKIPQLGIVQIDDDVEIGAGNTIDRAALDKTWIKRGAKTDNLVHIAHNVTIGEDTILVAQAGISGSTQIGNRVIMAGQTATVGHIKIGDDVIVGARGAPSSDIPAGQIVSGAPHMPHRTWLKAVSTYPKLPEMRKNLNELLKKVGRLESELEQLKGGKP